MPFALDERNNGKALDGTSSGLVISGRDGMGPRHQLTENERIDKQLRSGQLFEIKKQLIPTLMALEKPKTKDNKADQADAARKQADYLRRVVDYVCKPENRTQSGLTLIIVNTVDRATGLFDLLRKQPDLAHIPIKLIHSRFRPFEREEWQDFLDQKDQSHRILVSTQVVEAGVDLSAGVLYTELAPWASLVQRFGRCARYPGESGKIFWLDLELGSDKQPVDHWAKPYERSDLVVVRDLLETLQDVGLKSLMEIKEEMDLRPTGGRSRALFPYEPALRTTRQGSVRPVRHHTRSNRGRRRYLPVHP